MDYPECLDYLRRLGNEVLTMKFGLERIRALLSALGSPQEKYPSIIIAGTNGKGSVARFLASVLTASDRRVGLYTSPHLVQIEERFVVDDEMITRTDFARYFTRVARRIGEMDLAYHPTYFETLTALAFLYFAERGIEIAVLEVGMGGRLDSTNVVDPLLSIITPIGLDHQRYLGDTIAQIAFEKAGIIHASRPVLIAPQCAEALAVLRARAGELHAPLYELQPEEIRSHGTPEGIYSLEYHGVSAQLKLYGEHQVYNAALAIRAAELLAPRFTIASEAAREGISRTQLPGRVQRIDAKPLTVLDGGHNPAAAQNLVEFVEKHTRAPRALVLAMMADKDIRAVVEILQPCFSRFYLTSVDSPRAASPEDLLAILPSGQAVLPPAEALRQARSDGSKTVVVTGSFYLVGEILKEWRRPAGRGA